MENYNNIIHQAKFLLKTNWIAAINLLEEEAEKHPTATAIYTELADIYQKKGAHKKALENYQRVLNLEPDNTMVRFKVGNIYMDLHEQQLALYQYNQIKEPLPEALYNTALAYEQLGYHTDALNVLEDLVKTNDVTINVYYLLVEVCLNMGKNTLAMNYLKTMHKKFGFTPRVQYLMGVVHTYKRHWLAAYNQFLLVKDFPEYAKSPQMYHLLGIAAENVGMSDKAIEYLKHGITLGKKDRGLFLDLLKVLMRNKIITTKEDLKPFIADMDDDVIKMAMNLYEKFKEELLTDQPGDII